LQAYERVWSCHLRPLLKSLFPYISILSHKQ
jgi:hypothetical protein